MSSEYSDEVGYLPPLDEETSGNPDEQQAVPSRQRSFASVSPPSGVPQVRQQKWWHVSDSAIEALVRRTAESTLLPQAPPSKGYPGGRPRPRREEETRLLPQQTIDRRKTVHFEGDALDALLHKARGPPAKGEEAEEETKEQKEDKPGDGDDEIDPNDPDKKRKWWAVSDAQLAAKITEMARANGTGTKSLGEAVDDHRRGSPTRKSSSVCSGSPRKIAVNIYIVESGDTLTLRVNPEMRLGPPPPPATNAFTQVFGQGASTKGFDQRKREFDYRRRVFGNTQTMGFTPEWSTSLKQMIEKVMNIAPSRQRLHYKNVPISSDDLTLQSFGIQDGDQLQLRLARVPQAPAVQRGALVLACSRRKEEVRARQNQEELASQQPGCDWYKKDWVKRVELLHDKRRDIPKRWGKTRASAFIGGPKVFLRATSARWHCARSANDER
mmetsp:Transcript_5325/g.12727  ORF Transcript_5325/g.12727 Transcript_5325/m.12727 type:complete len:440 (+) Transcript_5325:114-1433(+)